MIKSSNHKKGVLVGVIAAFVLVVTLGVTFAIYNYSKVGENQILIAGDIYMKYTGTNQISATDMLPIDINDYYGEYIVNSNMTKEELSSCESFFNGENWDGFFQNDETSKAFCEGTGKGQDMTFQELLNSAPDAEAIEQDFSELIENNVIKKEFLKTKFIGYEYIVNSNMSKEQLQVCKDFFGNQGLDEVLQEGSTIESFCNGLGKITFDGLDMSFQKFVNIELASNAERFYENFSELIHNNVIIKRVKTSETTYKLKSNMTEEDLTFCENAINRVQIPFGEGETARAFCEGTGTIQGITLQKMIDEIIKTEPILIEIDMLGLVEKNIIIKESRKLMEIPYFEFKIEGVNKYSKDIWYEIVLRHGDEPEGRSERLRDDLLRFRLVEVVGEEEQEIFINKGYADISNERIYVSTIGANTKEKLTRTYRIYMWISDSVKVGVGDNVDYDMDTWNNEVYASVKINVAGDLIPKQLSSCFIFEKINNQEKSEIKIKDYDVSCGPNVAIPKIINDLEVTEISKDSFKKKDIESIIIPDTIKIIGDNAFSDNRLTSVNIPNNVESIGSNAFYNNNITKVEIPNNVITIHSNAFARNKLSEIKVGNKIKYIGLNAFGSNHDINNNATLKKIEIKKTCDEIKDIPASEEELENKYFPWTFSVSKDGLEVYGYEDGKIKLCDNKILETDLPLQPAKCFAIQEFNNQDTKEIMITDYDIDCGTDVVIPREISGHEVTVIGSSWKENNDSYIQPMAFSEDRYMSFSNKNLTNVVIPNTVRTIGKDAFSNNNLTKVEIPDSVELIDANAFSRNQINELRLGRGVRKIGDGAFQQNNLTKVEIPDSVEQLGGGGNGYGAFYDNNLETVIIGKGIKYISGTTFSRIAGAIPSNPNLSSITIDKTCEELKNISSSPENEYSSYPWTFVPMQVSYHNSGLTIYGSNGEVCDAFE